MGIANRLQQSPRQQYRILGPRQSTLDDGEFVGVETGERVLLTQHRAKALGHRAQQRVTNPVTERIVDRLEIVWPRISTAAWSELRRVCSKISSIRCRSK